MSYLLVLVVVGVAFYAISSPFRTPRLTAAGDGQGAGAGSGPVGQDPVAELEAARDAKYREIRDAELDVRTGKLSDEDYAELDGSLRAEAVEILHQLDESRGDGQRLPSAP
jgi:hypothetical protein